jgi:hypothetical protein
MKKNNHNEIKRTSSSFYRKSLAVIVPIFFFGASLWLIAWIADGLMLRNAKEIPRSKRAVLAIRDSVPSYEQFGTELFTEPYLSAYYDESYFFTQKGRNDQKELILESLKRLTTNYDCVDIFILAHTNPYLYWFEGLPKHLRQKIRLVYNTGCRNADQGKGWLKLGAKAYIGHKGKTSLSPFFYVYFLRRWVSGLRLDIAVKESNKIAKDEINLFQDQLPDPGEMDYTEQTHAHLFGTPTLQIDEL